MRAVVQRVREASVRISGKTVGSIGRGLLVLLGIAVDDTDTDLDYIVGKVAELRIFEDDAGKMNRSLAEISGAALIVSQFTLYGDCRRGRRPSFDRAAPGPAARVLYEGAVARLREHGIPTASGEFGAMMDVALVNDGPVTILLDSRKEF